MARHARKKQKTEKPSDVKGTVRPLGSGSILLDDATKDDEERRLESMLFGTAYIPGEVQADGVLVVSDEEDAPNKEYQNLLDTDLFFVDDAAGERSDADRDAHLDVRNDQSDDDASSRHSDAEGQSKDSSDAEDSPSESEDEPPTWSRRAGKGPAWEDPDDPTLQVSLAQDKRRRKLRDAASEDVVGGREYERRLRRQFEKINPTPDWAANARKGSGAKQAKRRRPASSSASSSDEEALPDLLTDTQGTLQRGKSKILDKGTLSIERLRDANLSAKAEGEIKVVQFHPSPQVPVLLTASSDRRLRLFNIDGHTNPHLQTVHVPSLPFTTALFHPGGGSVLLTGPRPFYYVYDLQSGAALRSPRGLWGTTFANSNAAAQDASMEICAFDPSGGVLAVAGRRGNVHLVDWRGGQGQVVGSVKMNAGVKSVWWGGASGTELMSLGEDSEVYVWDVGERRCVKRWKDDGGFGSHLMSGDKAGRYFATG
ncbi:hypothetical protein IEO21_04920 [Rhodonia placenta]|uniref:WD40 repeat-like protein n=1 Tax=Rhodonia placenta TaxID=104341 RepID=A0A8H7P2W3_9APHY|nr:hypothetical protein IEO21_04920 [Postia placenta]